LAADQTPLMLSAICQCQLNILFEPASTLSCACVSYVERVQGFVRGWQRSAEPRIGWPRTRVSPPSSQGQRRQTRGGATHSDRSCPGRSTRSDL